MLTSGDIALFLKKLFPRKLFRRVCGRRLLLCGVSLLIASTAFGAEPPSNRQACVADVCFLKTVEIGDHELPLIGRGLFRYWGFRVFSAALYAPSEWTNSKVFVTDTPSELVLEYHRSVSKEDIVASSNNSLAKQNLKLPEEVKEGVTKIHAAFEGVEAGDRYELRFEPGVGSSLYLNKRLVIQIPGEEFAQYYFRVWLDQNRPLDMELRKALFGFI